MEEAIQEQKAAEENERRQEEKAGGVRADKENRIRRNPVLLLSVFLLAPVLEYISIECFLKGDLAEIGLYYGFKNVLLLLSANILLVSVFHRFRPALLLSQAGVLALGIANYFVDAFRGYGIVYMDLFAVKTAAGVAGDYNYTLEPAFWLGLLTAAAGIALLFLPAPESGRRYASRRNMIAGGIGLAAALLFYLWLGNTFTFWEDVSGLTWDHNIGISKYGYVLYVTANAGEAEVEPPEGYSPEKAEEILSHYGKTSGVNSVLADRSGGVTSPNLIMIMNESFSDLEVLGDIYTDKPYLEYFRKLKKNTIRGYVESSVYGGYTANSEFEFLTGCSKAFLPGNPYLQYIKDQVPTVIDSILAQGNYQEAVAFHPYYPSGYNRNRVYPLLGFQKFLSLKDVKDPLLVRKYVSDETDYQMIRELYQQKQEGSSLCLFNVTMQNHSAYTDTDYQFEDPVRVISDQRQFEADQYLSLIKLSDEALEKLIKYFKKEKEPTLIVLFGDHQPHLPDRFYQKIMGKDPDDFNHKENMQKYKVPFFIWANYDIPEQEIECTSINYLSVLMMQAAGLELTDYQRFLLALHDKLPCISAKGYYDDQGRLYDWEGDKGQEEYGRLLEEYETVQYYYLFDKEHRQDQYFKIKRKK